MHLGPRARTFFLLTLAIFAGSAGTASTAPTVAELPSETLTGKIANGEPSEDYPSVGQLLTDQGTCSGTLVGCQTFLTAAHCICGDPVTGEILNGKQCNARPDLLDPAGKRIFLQHAGLFEVASIAVHPRFQFRVRSDLAVLTLARPVTGIGTSRLDLVEKPAGRSPATIVGFGIDGDGSLSGIKRVGAVTTSSCIGVNNATHLCFTFDNPLGLPGSNSDTCQGDSGGPLFVNFGTSEVVAGVTSGGTARAATPSTTPSTPTSSSTGPGSSPRAGSTSTAASAATSRPPGAPARRSWGTAGPSARRRCRRASPSTSRPARSGCVWP